MATYGMSAFLRLSLIYTLVSVSWLSSSEAPTEADRLLAGAAPALLAPLEQFLVAIHAWSARHSSSASKQGRDRLHAFISLVISTRPDDSQNLPDGKPTTFSRGGTMTICHKDTTVSTW